MPPFSPTPGLPSAPGTQPRRAETGWVPGAAGQHPEAGLPLSLRSSLKLEEALASKPIPTPTLHLTAFIRGSRRGIARGNWRLKQYNWSRKPQPGCDSEIESLNSDTYISYTGGRLLCRTSISPGPPGLTDTQPGRNFVRVYQMFQRTDQCRAAPLTRKFDGSCAY